MGCLLRHELSSECGSRIALRMLVWAWSISWGLTATLTMSACVRLRSAAVSLPLLRAALSWRARSSAMLAVSSRAAFTCA